MNSRSKRSLIEECVSVILKEFFCKIVLLIISDSSMSSIGLILLSHWLVHLLEKRAQKISYIIVLEEVFEQLFRVKIFSKEICLILIFLSVSLLWSKSIIVCSILWITYACISLAKFLKGCCCRRGVITVWMQFQCKLWLL